MTSPILQNSLWTVKQIAAFVAEARQKPTMHRSRYYKVSFLMAASVVEVYVFRIIKSYCANNTVESRREYKYYSLHLLPKELFKDREGVVGIYEKRPVAFEWKDNIDWKKMNEIGRKYGLFDRRLYRKLERIRAKRNGIHIQSVPFKDHKYTKKDVDYVGSVLLEVLDVMES